MDFLCFTLPRDTFPRFDNACKKSMELQSRYKSMLPKQKRERFQENKYVKVNMCKEENETEFPIEIKSIIAETDTTPNIDPGNITKSRSIDYFLNSREENDNTISFLIMDSRHVKKFNKLLQNKFYIFVVVEDDHVKSKLEEKFRGQRYSQIIVVKTVNISNEIDNLLERISLAPLKQICENCYDMLKLKDQEQSARFLHIESSIEEQTGIKYRKYRKVDTRSGSTCAETTTSPRNGYPYRGRHIAKDKTHELLSATSRRKGGTAKPTSFDQLKGVNTTQTVTYTKKLKANTINATSHTSTAIYTRSRSNLQSGSMLNGLKDKIRSMDIFGGKETEGRVGERSVETYTATRQLDKRKNKTLSEIDDQSSSGDQMKEVDNPESILEAILALYGMSNVPETERPDVPKHRNKVSKEMRKELFKISPSIKRMGYRYRTFYIYAVQPKTEAEEENRKKQIRSVLNKYDVNQFEIAPCAEQITEFSHVGAEIEARSGSSYSLRSRTVTSGHEIVKGGTLGCFANMNGEGQCGLLSKHVSVNCSDVYYVAKGNKKWIGPMIKATNKYQSCGLDISAAKINEPVGGDGTKFKDTRQTLLKGKLYEYTEYEEDAICTSGQSVHIYGAKSNPGKGEITMPFVQVGLSTTLIQVEDQVNIEGTSQERFAEKGDSGAIVCVEDPNRKDIHALSMVMGTQDLGDSSSTRRTYLTIPLSKGLQQLENDTGKKIKLC